MQKLILILAALLVIGCTSAPYQSPPGETWVSSKTLMSSRGIFDPFPVKYHYRAHFLRGDLSFIQLYASRTSTTWGFYRSAHGEDGYRFKFVQIDSEVSSSGGMVTTKEYFGLGLSLDQLKKMAEKDYTIHVKGKRDAGTFVVPASVSKKFYDEVSALWLKHLSELGDQDDGKNSENGS